MNTCVIEALYPEVCNLFGDTGNLRYLKLCLPQATFIETALNDEPYFVHHPVSMIYLGPMSEHTQCIIISKLAPYRERIAECIANGVTFLATGNAMEVFEKLPLVQDEHLLRNILYGGVWQQYYAKIRGKE